MKYFYTNANNKTYLLINDNNPHAIAAELIKQDFKPFDVYLKNTFINRLRIDLGCV